VIKELTERQTSTADTITENTSRAAKPRRCVHRLISADVSKSRLCSAFRCESRQITGEFCEDRLSLSEDSKMHEDYFTAPNTILFAAFTIFYTFESIVMNFGT